MTFQQLRSRRDFLRLGCRTISTVGAAAAFGQAGLMTARAQSSGNYQALVCIFLFGGNDANNMLVPNEAATYANYRKIRQNLALPQSSLLPIHDPATNGDYGLHPSFAPIAALYNSSKRLALLANVGTLVQPVPRGSNGLPELTSVPLPVNLYSHSDQQNEWQNAVPQGGATTGWSGRLADKLAGVSGTLVPPCISISGNALQLIGETTQPSTVNTSNFGLTAPATDPGSTALQNMLSLSSGVTLIQAAQNSLKDAIAVAQAVNAAVAGSGSLGVTFANTDIGTQLGQVAKLIQVRAALGATRQIFFCSQGGYDTHSNQLPQQVTLYSQPRRRAGGFRPGHGPAHRAEQRDHVYRVRLRPHLPAQRQRRHRPRMGQPRPDHGRRRERRQPVRHVPHPHASRPGRLRDPRHVGPQHLRGPVRRRPGEVVRPFRASGPGLRLPEPAQFRVSDAGVYLALSLLSRRSS